MKNGQHSYRLSPSTPRWAARLFVTAAVALAPGAALADEPEADPGQSVIVIDEALLEKLRAIADRAVTGATAATKPQKAEPKGPSVDAKADAKAARGVVTIERGGQPVGLGAVLASDGRILTALSPLGAGNDLDVRYADGSLSKVKLGHHDRGWDLALLVPQTGKWLEGVIASSREPIRPDATIRAFTAGRGGKLSLAPVTLRAHRALLGGDDRPLPDVLEMGSRVASTDLGSPLLDEDGRVVGLLGRGCLPVEGKVCSPVAFGVPVGAIRSFLRAVPASAVPPAAWLGIQGVPEAGSVARGVRILGVHPQSPAEVAQLKGGDRSVADTIVAVDGVPVTSPDALAEIVRKHAIGEKVPLLVYGQGKYRTVTVDLRAAPDADEPKAAAAHPAALAPAPAEPPRARRRFATPPPGLPRLPGED